MDFYFVDERGNTSINFETLNTDNSVSKYSTASRFFQIGIVKINNEHLPRFQEHFNAIRYFLNLTKEFEKIISSRKAFDKLWNIVQYLSEHNYCSLFHSYIEKELYKGPYLYTQEHHKFRIFSMLRALSYSMKVYKTIGSSKA